MIIITDMDSEFIFFYNNKGVDYHIEMEIKCLTKEILQRFRIM